MAETTYTITGKELAKLTQSGVQVTLAIEPITVSPTVAAELLGVSRPLIYQMMGRADFPKFKEGARCIIPVRELRDWAAKRARGEIQ